MLIMVVKVKKNTSTIKKLCTFPCTWTNCSFRSFQGKSIVTVTYIYFYTITSKILLLPWHLCNYFKNELFNEFYISFSEKNNLIVTDKNH